MSYIAESAGGFAFIGRDGKLYIRTIYQDEQEIPLELFGDYKWGDKCTITKVSYENGAESFKFGNDTGNNLWLNQDNMYIVEENQVEDIYIQVKDLEAHSFEGRVIIDPALDVGDKLIIDGKAVIYQGEADFQTRFIAEINSKISIKQKQETTVRKQSQKNVNRRVQSTIDEIEGKIEQIIQETDENTEKISQHTQTIDEITDTVSDTTERLNNDYSTTEQMNSAIEQTAGSITSSVTESIENIQVGGTNLIENSAPYNLEKWGISNSNSIELTLQDEETAPYKKSLRIRTLNYPTTACGIYKTVVPKVLEEGKEYCFSIWLKSTAATNVIVGYARGGQTTFNVTTEWKKFEYKFTALTPTGTSHGFAINVPARTTAGRSVYAHSIKLEEGNKITAWSPAPSDDVKGSEIGTKIEQNAKSVQVAWNQLSQSIKFEGDNSDATIAFYDGDTKFGEMGANTVDDNRYISFATLLDYGQSISDGMAWGIQTTSDNKFWPILFIKDFFMANKNAGNFSGQLVLNFCDLVLGTGAIKAENVRLGVDDTAKGIYFEDTESGDILMRVYPDSNIGYARIDILNSISFYKNQGEINSFKIGIGDKYIIMSDEGDFLVQNGSLLLGTSDTPVTFSLYLKTTARIRGDVSIDGKIYADNISSDRKLKNNIKDSNINALDLINKIKHRQFEMKKDKRHYDVGYIAQELEEIDKNFVIIREKDEKEDEQYYVNELPLLATATKAIQELNEKVERLQNKINELEEKLKEKEE